MQTFKSGATRDSDTTKMDYEGFLSPLALQRYAEYLHKHRKQADGEMRDSDNWQKGIPFDIYMKSMFRHLVNLWTIHRGHIAEDKDGNVIDIEEALSAVIFNAFGYLHELLIDKGTPELPSQSAEVTLESQDGIAEVLPETAAPKCSRSAFEWQDCCFGFVFEDTRKCHVRKCDKPPKRQHKPVADFAHGDF